MDAATPASTGRLTGRRVAITGGARGIGRAVAGRCAQDGAAVGIIDIEEDLLTATVAGLRDGGARAEGEIADVSRPAEARGAIDRLAGRLGGLDGLVTVAGITQPAPALEMDEAAWERVLDVNLSGVFFAAQAALRRLVEADGGGAIVAVGSVAAMGGPVGRANYSASKAGIEGLIKNLAVEFGPRGVRCNVVAPGHIRSPMGMRDPEAMAESAARTPLRRLGTVDDVAAACAFFLSDDAGWITGQVLNVCGGKTLWSPGVS